MKTVLTTTILMLLTSLVSAAPILNVTSSTDSTTVGSTFNVNLSIENATSDDVYGFLLDVNFDDALVDFVGITFGTDIGGVIPSYADHTDNGNAIFVEEFSFGTAGELDGQADSFTLATLTFEAINVGMSLFNLSNVEFSDGNGFEIVFDTIGNDSITINSNEIPVPATGLLMVVGLAAFAVRKRQ
ncbi:hypothetical protein OLMES_2300 [Oleiphilus messinensis]|uniref:Cohesin domain-containing protein n=1 Tax=Oleiphilus messinensis TaxID=141451 RepID=A0A1Y0IAE0_9GAMM|nr:cohesin domain-containing protein [Oleiphilus messinensis]ARU56363.1 hypothetical protein OLMES_2300 [Oleiphilus messinensis]